MNIASKEQVRIDRLADDSYIVTKQDPATFVNVSESCRSEGEMVGAVLRAIMRTHDSATWQRRADIAAMATVSLDKAIEEWRG